MNYKALLMAATILSMTFFIPLNSANAVTVPNPDTFTYLTTGGPQNIDPARCYDTASAEVIDNVYMCLISFEFDKLDSFDAMAADYWPGYGVNEGNAITPSPPALWTFTNTTAVNLASPVSSHWTRKSIDYTLSAWEDGAALNTGDNITLRWNYDPNNASGIEDLDFRVEQVNVAGSVVTLKLTPYFIDATWYFHIRTGIKWQNQTVGTTHTLTPYDVEYSYEREMVHNPSSGPVWMFLDPLLDTTSTRGGKWNWPKYAGYDPALADQTAELARQIDDAVESNDTYVWFNLAKPYAPFMQILCQSWGSILDAEWTMLQWDSVSNTHNWNASWHVTPGLQGYRCIVPFNKPAQPGPLSGTKAMGTGPYYVQYINIGSGEFFLHKFDDYYFGWSKPYCTLIHHEVVSEWATRRTRFLSDSPSDQADMVTVLRGDINDPELLAAEAAGDVRYIKDLPTMTADAIFFSWEYDDSLFPNYIGIAPGNGALQKNCTLLSDVHLRIALAYCFNATEFINDYFQGEAVTLHNPNIYGNAYANATKHLTMAYTKNIELATYHFQMAWGGVDANHDGICESPGQVWNYGFKMEIEPTPDADPRTKPCIMMRDVVENEIEWPSTASVEIKVTPLDWDYAMTQVAERTLGAYVCGWLADFPHPHNWMFPFMHTEGDFTWTSSIHYGRKLIGTGEIGEKTEVVDTAGMNWDSRGSFGQHGLPYTNWKGDTVTDITNDYVDSLIMTGISLTDPAEANALYNELADIYHADVPNIMTFQPSARHYERSWVQGWFYNAVYAGLLFMGEQNLWKEDPATVTYDLESTIHVDWSTKDVIFDAHNYGPPALIYEENEAEFSDPTGSIVPTCAILPGTAGYYTINWDSSTKMWTVKSYLWAWLPTCKDTDLFKVHYHSLVDWTYANETIDYRLYHLAIVDVVPSNNFKEKSFTPARCDFTGPGYPTPAPPQPPPDCVININDIRYFIDAFLSQYGIPPPAGNVPAICDLTGPGYPPLSPPDGTININDIRCFIDAFLSQYGIAPPWDC